MATEHPFGRYRRNTRLAQKFANKRFRDSYVSANVRRFLAMQLRTLRGHLSQEEFGELIGIPQSVVSRYEDPSYGKFSLETLLKIAAKLDRALIARIVDYPAFLRFTEDVSPQALCPDGYDQDAVDRFSRGLPISAVFSANEDDQTELNAEAATSNLILLSSAEHYNVDEVIVRESFSVDDEPRVVVHG